MIHLGVTALDWVPLTPCIQDVREKVRQVFAFRVSLFQVVFHPYRQNSFRVLSMAASLLEGAMGIYNLSLANFSVLPIVANSQWSHLGLGEWT